MYKQITPIAKATYSAKAQILISNYITFSKYWNVTGEVLIAVICSQLDLTMTMMKMRMMLSEDSSDYADDEGSDGDEAGHTGSYYSFVQKKIEQIYAFKYEQEHKHLPCPHRSSLSLSLTILDMIKTLLVFKLLQIGLAVVKALLIWYADKAIQLPIKIQKEGVKNYGQTGSTHNVIAWKNTQFVKEHKTILEEWE
ncbi:hypothetical protein EDD85DRAFT_795519 [Armillaria nabsnona]|nr:hypothetical protein EDD85DRAFT_795519 [Armillaria nabsnona]